MFLGSPLHLLTSFVLLCHLLSILYGRDYDESLPSTMIIDDELGSFKNGRTLYLGYDGSEDYKINIYFIELRF